MKKIGGKKGWKKERKKKNWSGECDEAAFFSMHRNCRLNFIFFFRKKNRMNPWVFFHPSIHSIVGWICFCLRLFHCLCGVLYVVTAANYFCACFVTCFQSRMEMNVWRSKQKPVITVWLTLRGSFFSKRERQSAGKQPTTKKDHGDCSRRDSATFCLLFLRSDSEIRNRTENREWKRSIFSHFPTYFPKSNCWRLKKLLWGLFVIVFR